MMNGYIALRLLFVLPAIFLASYLVAGLLIAFVAAFWPFILGVAALLVGLVLLAAKVS